MRSLRITALAAIVLGLSALGWAAALDSQEPPSLPRTETSTTYQIRATPTSTTLVPREPSTAGSHVESTPTTMPYDGVVSRLKLPKFGVDSAVEYIGILPNNQLDVPKDPLKTGWYDIYDKPGFPGNAVFSAHVDYFPDIIGPFNKLSYSEIGDTIIVTMEDGREYRYKVILVARYNVDTIPMGDIVWPPDRPAEGEWITLITCGGQFRQTSESGAGEYLQRDVVVAERDYS